LIIPKDGYHRGGMLFINRCKVCGLRRKKGKNWGVRRELIEDSVDHLTEENFALWRSHAAPAQVGWVVAVAILFAVAFSRRLGEARCV